MTTDIKFTTRLPAALKAWLENRSIRNHRSMNSEIVAIFTALRKAEDQCLGFENFANPSGIPGSVELFSDEEQVFIKNFSSPVANKTIIPDHVEVAAL